MPFPLSPEQEEVIGSRAIGLTGWSTTVRLDEEGLGNSVSVSKVVGLKVIGPAEKFGFIGLGLALAKGDIFWVHFVWVAEVVTVSPNQLGLGHM